MYCNLATFIFNMFWYIKHLSKPYGRQLKVMKTTLFSFAWQVMGVSPNFGTDSVERYAASNFQMMPTLSIVGCKRNNLKECSMRFELLNVLTGEVTKWPVLFWNVVLFGEKSTHILCIFKTTYLDGDCCMGYNQYDGWNSVDRITDVSVHTTLKCPP